MNILFLNSYPVWGGGETWMLDTADGLRERGHRCILAGSPGRSWYERTRELRWDPVALSLRGELAPRTYARLRRLFREDAIDIVLCNFDKEARIAGIARLFDRSPLIVNLKGLPLLSDNLRYRFSYRRLIDHTVVCARFIREEFARHPWLDMRKVSIIYNCYRPPAASSPATENGGGLRAEAGFAPQTKVVGAVARFDRRKGLHDLIAAAPGIIARHQDARFVIVGDGGEKERLERLAQTLGVSDRIVFTGFRRDLDRIVSAFDVFVLPSHKEGFPYVLQIAMHHARAIVAARVDGIPDAIEDGENGVLIEPRNPARLAAAVSLLLENPDLRMAMGRQARATLDAKFSYPGMIDAFEDLFTRLLRERSPSA